MRIIAAILLGLWLLDNQSKNTGIGAIPELPGVKKHYEFIDVYSILPGEGGRNNGKTNLGFANGVSGVYMIAENDQVVYVGKSLSNLYKTIMRHFQIWIDDRHGRETGDPNRLNYRDRLNRNNYTVSIIEIANQKNILIAESVLINDFDPRDNYRSEETHLPDNAEEIADALLSEDYSDVPF